MKNLLALIVASFICALSQPALASSVRIDGFCTMDILAMERATHIDAHSPSVKGFAKEFYDNTLVRAKALYADQEIYYDENATISVFKANVLFGKDALGNGNRLLGTKITLWTHGDEDLITYYFYRDTGSDKAQLKMYLHDDESATSYWVCELP